MRRTELSAISSTRWQSSGKMSRLGHPSLQNAYSREQNEALDNQETRPLWQLLVCITQAWKTPELSEENRNRLRNELRQTQNFLNADPHLDSGGQCKGKIGMLFGLRLRSAHSKQGVRSRPRNHLLRKSVHRRLRTRNVQ